MILQWKYPCRRDLRRDSYPEILRWCSPPRQRIRRADGSQIMHYVFVQTKDCIIANKSCLCTMDLHRRLGSIETEAYIRLQTRFAEQSYSKPRQSISGSEYYVRVGTGSICDFRVAYREHLRVREPLLVLPLLHGLYRRRHDRRTAVSS